LTAGLLVFAVYQVLSTRKDAKISRTLAACDRYDTDPILDEFTRRVSIAYDDGSLLNDPKKYRFDLHGMFNYFESIAIGVSHGHYDEGIVRGQLKEIIDAYVDCYILSGIIDSVGVSVGEKETDYLCHLMKLHRKWKIAGLR
jgi:hypothetical protein